MIAVLYAMEGEIGELLERFSLEEEISPKRLEGCVIRKGKYGNHEILLVQTGVGLKVKGVAEFILEEFPIELIIVVGCAGGLREKLKSGDFIVCSPIIAEGEQPLFPNSKLCYFTQRIFYKRDICFLIGEDLTILYFAPQAEEKQKLSKQYPRAVIVEMENYWVASIAKSKRIPFLAVRVVSDSLKETIPPPNGEGKHSPRFYEIANRLRNEFLIPFLERL